MSQRKTERYISIPTVVEAERWDGQEHPKITKLVDRWASGVVHRHVIDTLQGPAGIEKGDWILGPGPGGPDDFWPAKHHVFIVKYRRLTPNESSTPEGGLIHAY